MSMPPRPPGWSDHTLLKPALFNLLPGNVYVSCTVLAALVVCAFLPVLRQGFLSYDDGDYVTANTHVQSGLTLNGFQWAFSTVAAGNWHPLTWLSHMLDCQLYSLQPWGHHLTSLLLHAADTVLVFLVFRYMTRANGRSFVVAALFGLHPMHVESVAWVAERKDALSTLFFLLTLWAYAAYVRAAPRSFRSRQFYCSALVLFALGLMSKPMLVTLPFVLILLDYWPLGRFGPSTPNHQLSTICRLLLEKMPFFLLAVAASGVAFIAQKNQGAMAYNIPSDFRLGNALVAYWRYLGKLVWPSGLSILYPFPDHPWPGGLVTMAGLCLGVVTVTVLVLGSRRGYLPVGWFWFLGTLVPVIGVVQVGAQSMADRYVYIPSIGFFVMLTWGLCGFLQPSRYGTAAAGALAAGAILGCLAATRQELTYWQDGETLFRRALAVTAPNSVSLDALGAELLSNKRWDESIPLFQQAIKLTPEYAAAHLYLGAAFIGKHRFDDALVQFQEVIRTDPGSAEAHAGLGTIFFNQGRLDGAISEYEASLKIRPEDAVTHRNLAISLTQAQLWAEAANEYEQTLTLNPGDAASRIRLAWVLFRGGQMNRAIEECQRAVRFDPDNADAHNTLGQLLTQAGRMDEAIKEYTEAIRLNPNLAQTHYFLGGALAEEGRLDDAILEFRAALKIQPDNADVQNDLGMALDSKGELAEAISHFREAIRLKPDDPETHNSLGVSLWKAGKIDEGIAEFRETLRLSPNHPGAQKNLDAALIAKTGGTKNSN
jgi:tetratricopeptide (TPR) repeat protein